ncbi:MAG: two-component regulator propeller domain-containing protein [Acidobacteriota bacterium]|nr:two-component regulator propeller domain-containing protein [Acidobacteriota bacterium]
MSLLFFLWMGGLTADAREAGHHFQRLGLDEGLQQNTITALAQDRDGFLWIGTYEGLYRYDGNSFTHYKNNPDDPNSLSDDAVYTILPNDDGTIWVGTSSGGLNQLDPNTGYCLVFRRQSADAGLGSDKIRVLLRDSKGRLWIGTTDGLNMMDPIWARFSHYKHDTQDPNSLPSDIINGLVEGPNGLIWVGTTKGLAVLDPETADCRRLPEATPKGPSNRVIRDLEKDDQDRIWVATEGGLAWKAPDEDGFNQIFHDPARPDSLPADRVTCLTLGGNGLLWVGTQEGLACLEDAESARFKVFKNDPFDPGSLSTGYILSLFEDSYGVLWIGTRGGWLNKFNPRVHRFRHYRVQTGQSGSLSHNNIRTIMEDPNGTLWLGSVSGGLNRLDRGADGYRVYRKEQGGLLSDRVYALAWDSRDLLWVGTDRGLNLLNPKTDRIETYSADPKRKDALSDNRIRSLLYDHEGTLWVGTKWGGLNRYLPEEDAFHRYPIGKDRDDGINDPSVYQIFRARDGRLWLGTLGGGVNRLDPATDKIRHYPHLPKDPKSLSHDRVYAIAEDGSGNLWIGTDAGLNRYDSSTDTFERFFPKSDFSNKVCGLVVDDRDHIWMSNARGIARLIPQTAAWRHYDADFDILRTSFNIGAFTRTPDGRIYFGGINGYNMFRPEELLDDPYSARPLIQNLSLKGKPVSLAGLHTVDVAQGDFPVQIGWTGLHFGYPDWIRFRYMLEGFDDDWIEVGADRRSIVYNSLPVGEYDFRLKALNADGLLSEEQVGLHLSVKETPWFSWWAWLLYGGAALLAIRIMVRIKTYRLERRQRLLAQQNQELEQRVAERTQMLADAQRELVERAHQAGRAEIAISILHNVGNVLNSVNVSGQELARYRETSHLERLNRGVTLLKEILAVSDHPKAADLCTFFCRLEGRMKRDYENLQHHVSRIQERIEIIREVIRTQQSYAAVSSHTETVKLSRLIRDALEIVGGSLERNRVNLDLRGDMELQVLAQKTKLIHVFLNIIKNAGEAMRASADRKLTIDIDGEGAFVRVRFADTGTGIDPEHMKSVFTHGFTTKNDGNGFGLHSCATAISEMGGTLKADSDGRDKGAVFTVRLPKQVREAAGR